MSISAVKQERRFCQEKTAMAPSVVSKAITLMLMQLTQRSAILLVSVVTYLLLSSLSRAEAKLSTLDKLFSFGDSNNDTGNSATLTSNSSGSTLTFPPPPYFNGRASNGLLAQEYLWSLFNPSSPGLIPSYLGGTNYAISGATTGSINFNTISPVVPDSLKPAFLNLGASAQLNRFLLDQPTFIPDFTLFYISTFPNDVTHWLSTSQAPGGIGLDSGTVTGLPAAIIGSDQSAISRLVGNGVKNTELLISALHNQGAKHFLVPSVIDLGVTPLFRNYPDPSVPALISQMSASYNLALAGVLIDLQNQLPGLDITFFRSDLLLADVIQNPATYGFANVTEACLDIATGEICSSPDRWLFWDYFHPTTAVQKSIANLMFDQIHLVPAPAPFPAIYIAFCFSRSLRRRIKTCDTALAGKSKHS